jgi:hypothetical protein
MNYDSSNPFADLPDATDDMFADLPSASSGGLLSALGSGVDKVQELGYRAVKGFTDVGENPNDFEDGTASKWVAESIGQGGSLSKLADKGIARNLEEQQAYQPTVPSYKDVDSIGSAASYVGELTAGSLPYMAAALYPPSMLALGGGLSNEAYEAQEEKSPGRAIASGFGQMALERVGALGSFGKIKQVAGGKASGVVKSALSEGATESGQDALAQWGTGKSLDEINTDSLMESFVGGAAVGGTIRTGTEVANEVQSRIKPKLSTTETTDLFGDTEAPVQQTVGNETTDYDPTIQPSALSTVGGEVSQDWQPDWQFGQNDMPYRGQMTPYTYEGEILDPFSDIPNSVPVGQVLESPVIEGEFNRPLGLPDNSNIIYGNDLREKQGNLNYQTDNKPFGGKKAAAISKGFKQAQAQGLEPEVIKVDGGYGWRINNDRVDTGSIERQSVDESGSTGIAQLDNQWQAEQPRVSGNAEGNGRDSEQDISVGSGSQSNDNAVIQNKFEGLEIQEAPLNELTLSDDVPQFKDGANDEGVVTPLGGKFDRTGVAPIQVWVREDGRKEVVTGRHRLDLARRSNEETIPAQFHYEEDGFTAANAAQLDAILNIRDNQGQVKDYVNYFQATKITEEKAKSEGLLRQALGRRAYSIANRASEDVIASHSAGIISDEAAERLANVAPNEDKYQTLGLQKLQEGKGIAYTENFIRAVKSMEGDQGGSETMDMFGQDTSASIEADKMVKIASRKQRELRERLNAIRGAAKNPKIAKAEGINIKDPNSLNKRIDQLTEEAREWDNFHTNPKLVSQIRSEIGAAPLETKAEATQEVEPVETAVDENQDSLFGEPETERQRLEREKSDQAKNQAQEKQSKENESKARANTEVDDFRLSGSDRSADVATSFGQNDMFGEPESVVEEEPAKQEVTNAEPAILSQTKSKWLNQELTKAKINKNSPGFEAAKAKIEERYDDEIDKAYAQLPFDRYNELNSDTPESINRSAYEALTGKKVEQSKPKENLPTETVDKAVDKVETPNLANTDDVGGELSYNRRSWAGITSKDIDSATNDTEKLKMAQKEKVWKRPNYEELVANGMDAHKAYFIKLVYDAIAAKPKYKSDKQLKIYVDAIGEIRDSIEGIVRSKEFSQLYLDAIQEVAQSTRSYMSMVAAGGKMKAIGDMVLDKVLPKDDKGYRWGRNNPEGNEKAVLLGNFTSKVQFGSKQLRDSVEAVMGNGWPAKQEMWQKSYEIKERNNEFLVTKKGRGKILGTFNTKEAAEQFAKDDSKTERSVQFKEPKVSLNNIKRTGPDYREGKNVSTEEVMNEFGLRGINFGNWIKGDSNAKERQLHINHIYDGLMDLSDLLNIPPKAIGLNGMLGVAVGAQGNGGKYAAHFVPGLNEINITRNSGAGSLAHEWGHALDHYFAVQAGLARVEDPFLSDYSGYSRSFPGDIRPEIVEAYRSLMKAMKSKEFIETPEEVEQGRKAYFERSERDLLKGIKAARNEIERTDKAYLAEFDKLANDVVNNPPGEYVAIGKTKDYADESVVKLYDLLVKAKGRSADKNIFRYIESQKRSMNYAKSAEEYAKIHTPQTSVSTDFKKGAANLDGATKKPYWSTNLEMFARAFEMYVLDRLSDNGKRSDYMTAAWKRDNDRYLEHNKDAYPQDQEAVEINKAFDTLLGEIKTKEGENGNVIMFNRSTPINGSGVTVKSAKLAFNKFLKQFKGLDDEGFEQVITDKKPSEIFTNAELQPGDDRAIKGAFDKDTNRLYIFTQNHTSIDDIRATLREELLTHKGLGVFEPQEISELLSKINATRKSDNAEIKAIWKDIDKNYGNAPELVQAEEFLGKVSQQEVSVPSLYWNRIVAYINKLLRRFNLVKDGITMPEMRAVVSQISAKLQAGNDARNYGYNAQGFADSGLNYNMDKANHNNKERTVYHGSPYKFDAPNLSNYGNGEGGLGYGYGLHVTSSPRTANNYATPNPLIIIDGKEYWGNDVENTIAALILDKGYSTTLADIQKAAKENPDNNFSQKRLATVKKLKSSKIEDKRSNGEVYDFEISDSDLDGYLDFTKPLSEQSGTIINSLKDANEFSSPSQSGEDFYYNIAENLGEGTEGDRLASEYLDSLGINGIKYNDDIESQYQDDGGTYYNYTVFSPDKLIKKKSNIMFNRSTPESAFNLPDETKAERAIRFVQDKLNRVKKVQKIVGEAGIKTSDKADVYGKESLYYGKVEEDFRQLSQDFIEPIADKLGRADIPQPEFDLYLYALHAKERNAYINSIDENMKSGSGMTNEEANAIIDSVNADPRKQAFIDANKMVRAMIDKRVEKMSEAGLIDDETFASLQDSYQNYVPLKGQAKDEGGKPKGTGMGFNVKGKETIAALGRKSKAESPLLHSFIDTQKAIVRANKNEVGNAMLDLIEEAPNPELWNAYTTEGPMERKKDSSGQVVNKAMSASTMSALASNPMSEWFATKRDGVTHYIKFEDPLIAQQMKNFGVDNGNFITRTLGMVNRYLSFMSTSANPEFMVTNLIRDVQTALFNVASETEIADGKIKGLNATTFGKKAVKDLPKAFMGIRSALRNNDLSSEWAQVFDDFRKNGAKTGYFDMKDLEGQERDLQELMKLESKNKFMKYKDNALKFIEDYNSSVENAVRLSVYKTALDSGVSKHKAAVLAKNLTVNFNRKGEAGTWLNSLFLFANAGIQGTSNFARAIGTFKIDENGNKKLNLAQKAGIAMAGIAFSMAVMNRMISDDDDDGESYWDKIPDYIKERNFVLMHPNGKDYFTLPMPYGYNIFANFGTSAESVMLGGGKVSDNAAFLAKATMGSFLPFGLSQGGDVTETAFKTFTPQIGKPVVDIITNTNFFGSQIYREANEMYGDKRSDSALGRDKTNQAFKTAAKYLNMPGGGTEYQEGWIDVHPETLRYMVEYLGGGLGATVLRTAETAARAKDGEFESNKTPFVRRFYGKVNDYGDQTAFYDRLDELAKYKAEFDSLKGRDKLEFRKENLDFLRLEPMAEQTKKQLKQLRNRKTLFESKGMKDRIEQVDKQMESLVDKFNKQYNTVMEKR